MNKLYSILSVFILAISITLNGWAAHPCMLIAKACMKDGYYKGGNKVGRGLVENCILPVVTHRKILPNATFSDATLKQCKVMLIEKMKSYQANK